MKIKGFVKKIYFATRKIRHRILRGGVMRPLILRDFYQRNSERKVHLGCGERILPGWLNADIYNGDLDVNIATRLPFKDSSIDYVYSHHVIEHIELEQFVAFSKELQRICRTGAHVRLVTPDLKKMAEIYDHPECNSDVIDHYCRETRYKSPAEFFNMELRQKGEHKYIYDFDLLKLILEEAGFGNILQSRYGESSVPAFHGIDLHGYRIIDKISLIIEARK